MQSIIDLGFDITKFDVEKQHIYEELIKTYELTKKISDTKIVIGSSGGWQELRQQLEASQAAVKKLQDANVALTQSIANNTKAELDAAKIKLANEKADAIEIKNTIARTKEQERLNKAKSDYKAENIPLSVRPKEPVDVSGINDLSDAERQLQIIQEEGLLVQTSSSAAKKKDKLITDELAKAEQALKFANSEQNVALKGYAVQTELANKSAKQQAMENLGLVSSYQKLSNNLEAARLNAKDMAATFGVNSTQAKAAAKEVLILDTTIKGIDKSVGQSQRNVGNYGSALTKLLGPIRILANILPGIGMSGIILLGVDAIKSIVQEIGLFDTAMTDAARHNEVMKKSVEGTNTSYESAVKNVVLLTDRIKLAKQGFIDKKETLNEYNNTIGKTLGAVKNLDEAEAALTKNGEAYIEMTFQKALAEQAFAEAAKSAFDIQKHRMDDMAEINNLRASGINGANAMADDILKQRDKGINESQKNLVQALNIGLEAEKKAADISKKIGADFYSGEKDSKVKKEKQKEIDLQADEFNKKRLEELAKASLQELKILQDKYRSIASDQDKSISDRLEAEQNYYDVTLQLAQKDKEQQLGVLQAEIDLALKKAKNDADRTAILGYQKAKEQNIIKNANRVMLGAEEDFGKETNKIIKEGFAKDEKELQDHVAFLKQLNTEKLKQLSERVGIGANNEATTAITKYTDDSKDAKGDKRIKLEEALQRKLNEIDKNAQLQKLQIEENNLESIKAFMQEFGIDTTDTEAEITENLRKQAELRKGITDDEYANRKKQREELAAAEKQLAEQGVQLIQTLVEGGYDRQKNAIQALIDQNNEYATAETTRINNSTLSETDKAAKLTQLRAETEAKNKQYAKQQKDEDIKKAKFDKAVAIAKIIESTAVAVVKSLPEGLVTGLTYLIGAIGAVQLAAAIATPVPAYADGEDDHAGGWAIVGEGKRKEAVKLPSGKTFIADRPMLMDLPKHTQVIPLEATMPSLQFAPVIKDNDKAMPDAWAIARWQVAQLKDAPKQTNKIINKIDIGWAAYINGRIFRK